MGSSRRHHPDDEMSGPRQTNHHQCPALGLRRDHDNCDERSAVLDSSLSSLVSVAYDGVLV